MSQLPRINIKLVVAAICIVAGFIILWRTFATPASQVSIAPTSVATQAPTRQANAVLVGTTPPALLPTEEPLPTTELVATSEIPPTATALPPTAILPTAALVSATPEAGLTPSATTIAASATTEAQSTSAPTATPVPVATTPVPSQAARATLTPTLATSLTPTTLPTTAVAATITTSPAPTTITATPVATPTTVTVTYTVTAIGGTVSQTLIGYADPTGEVKDIRVPLPWSITLQMSSDGDFYLDAVAELANEQDVMMSCSIQINGSSVFYGKQLPSDQETSTNGGVTCDAAKS